jgi:hypothetical protein
MIGRDGINTREVEYKRRKDIGCEKMDVVETLW